MGVEVGRADGVVCGDDVVGTVSGSRPRSRSRSSVPASCCPACSTRWFARSRSVTSRLLPSPLSTRVRILSASFAASVNFRTASACRSRASVTSMSVGVARPLPFPLTGAGWAVSSWSASSSLP